ncbi:NAD(P)H pyrophosphatase NUDT13, mitochondrial [Anabrus simplex]|uniref:NAD(P)H pyrophosphatase NUDT13, mitochondrial n=1 Tax=Anabrus simplex TaxID=316456 RepID=UPI0035A36927
MYILSVIRNRCSCVVGTSRTNIISKSWSSSFLFPKNELYVRTVRAQQRIKQATECPSKFYADGQYLVLDIKKDLVLVNEKRTNDNLHTLLWRPYSDFTSSGFNVTEDAVFLSINDDEKTQFAVPLSSSTEKHADLETKFNGRFVPLRKSLFTLSIAESVVVSQSYSLLQWKRRFNFCPSCGGCLTQHVVGAQKVCSSCNETHYPNITPVGIVLVTNEDHSKALLVRQPMFPAGLYTCIAGFVEVGESIEENIRREVAEEVGLAVHKLDYFGSQHWAIPGSRLMVACIATVHDEEVDIGCDELEDAKWFTPQQVLDAVERVTSQSTKVIMSDPSQLWVPPRGAIAHNVIKYWLKKYHSM